MGKRNKKAKAAAGSGSDPVISGQNKRELLELINQLLEKCSTPYSTGSQEWRDYLDTYDLVEKIRKKQQHCTIKHFNRDNHRAGFIDWLKKNGVDTSVVSIAKFQDAGHGLRADKDIETSELLMAVPRKIMLTTETAKESVLGPIVTKDRILQAMPNVALALHLLCERMTLDSFWTPYMKILPAKYTVPLYFAPKEMQLLKGSPTLSDALNQYRNIGRQYAYFYKLFHSVPEASKLPIKDFCYDDYRWAVSTVMTRQNQIPGSSEDDKVVTALIPFWDMSNHSNGQITTDFDKEKDAVVCYALMPYKKFHQVYIFYGSRSNADLLLYSGFVYPHNKNDRLSIKFGVSKNDPLYGMRAEILARLTMLPSRIFHLHAGDQSIDSELLAYMRVFNMEEDAMKERLTGENASELMSNLRDFAEFVTRESEGKAWKFLETRTELLLLAYPTSLQQDETLLKCLDLSEHARLAVQLTLCEKKILQSAKVFAAKQRMVVESLPALRKALLEEQNLDDAIQDICINPQMMGHNPMQLSDDQPEEPRKGPTIIELDEDQPEPETSKEKWAEVSRKGPTIIELEDDPSEQQVPTEKELAKEVKAAPPQPKVNEDVTCNNLNSVVNDKSVEQVASVTKPEEKPQIKILDKNSPNDGVVGQSKVSNIETDNKTPKVVADSPIQGTKSIKPQELKSQGSEPAKIDSPVSGGVDTSQTVNQAVPPASSTKSSQSVPVVPPQTEHVEINKTLANPPETVQVKQVTAPQSQGAELQAAKGVKKSPPVPTTAPSVTKDQTVSQTKPLAEGPVSQGQKVVTPTVPQTVSTPAMQKPATVTQVAPPTKTGPVHPQVASQTPKIAVCPKATPQPVPTSVPPHPSVQKPGSVVNAAPKPSSVPPRPSAPTPGSVVNAPSKQSVPPRPSAPSPGSVVNAAPKPTSVPPRPSAPTPGSVVNAAPEATSVPPRPSAPTPGPVVNAGPKPTSQPVPTSVPPHPSAPIPGSVVNAASKPSVPPRPSAPTPGSVVNAAPKPTSVPPRPSAPTPGSVVNAASKQSVPPRPSMPTPGSVGNAAPKPISQPMPTSVPPRPSAPTPGSVVNTAPKPPSQPVPTLVPPHPSAPTPGSVVNAAPKPTSQPMPTSVPTRPSGPTPASVLKAGTPIAGSPKTPKVDGIQQASSPLAGKQVVSPPQAILKGGVTQPGINVPPKDAALKQPVTQAKNQETALNTQEKAKQPSAPIT